MPVDQPRPPAAPKQRGLQSPDQTSYGALGALRLDMLRETALRAGRLAELLFGAAEADVVAVRDGRVWRGKPAGPDADDAVARWVATNAHDLWIADTHLDPMWRDHPATQGPGGVRFCATAIIHLSDGSPFGVVRVFDMAPRVYDAALAAGLREIAGFVAEACDRLLNGDIKRMRELFDQAPGFMCILSGPDHVHALANSAYLQLVGDRAVVGRTVLEALPEIAAQGALALLDQVFRSGEPYVARAARMEIRRQPEAPLEVFYTDVIYQPLRAGTGEVAGIFVQGQDVTRETLGAERLVESELQLRAALSANQAIIDQSLDVICTMDADGRFTKVSKRAEQVWGYAPDEMVGRRFSEFLHPEDLAETLMTDARIKSGTPITSFTNRYLHKSGAVVPIMWSSVWSETHQVVVAVGRDMREHLEAESRLRQAQKMEAIGRLTGGIAHDFNNLLTVVIGTAETLAQQLADRPDLRSSAELALEAAERGAELVRQLLAFARHSPLAAKSVDCNALLESLVPMLQRLLGANIELVVETSPDPLLCLADSTQLTSAMLNICINARDAMPDGGRLSIRAWRVEEESGAFGYPQYREAGEIVLEVSDTGHGMSQDTIARVMEPFFTTKPMGQGTGLGLSMVYGFVTQSGGRIEIQSALGRGTAISIHLPETRQAVTRLPIAQPVAAATPGKSHILVVEDDALVRRQVESQLASLGYEVSVCSDGKHALDMLASSTTIQLLLTDVVMPGGMNGCDLAELARRLYPGLRIVLTSGYTDDALTCSPGILESVRFLAKPYRRAELARVLSAALPDV